MREDDDKIWLGARESAFGGGYECKRGVHNAQVLKDVLLKIIETYHGGG